MEAHFPEKVLTFMNLKLSKVLNEEPKRSIIYLLCLILVRLGMQISLYRQGFISVAADEFARGIIAAKWAENPQFNILSDVQGTWLPLEKYLNGLSLMLWPDVILAPRATVFIASCLLLIVIYKLTHYLFNNVAVSMLSTLFIAFLPWFNWLSGTPMLEMYYFTCFFAGLYFIIAWLKDGYARYWLWAGICFLLASGLHVQSWTFINLLNLLTLPSLYRFYRQKEYTNLSKLIAFYVLSNGFIISFALIEFFSTGSVFAFLEKHTSYSKWYYNGYDVPILEKLLYYPKLIVQHSSGVIWIFLLVAFFFLWRDREWLWKLFPLLLATLALSLNSVLNIFSGPPSAAPARYSLFYLMVLSIYLAYATYHLFKAGWSNSQLLIKVPIVTMTVILFSYGIYWSMQRIPNYPKGMSLDSVEVGENLNIFLDEKPGTYMVELHYWDFLAVDLTSRHFDKIIFDRKRDGRDRNTPSIFLQEPPQICAHLLAIPELQYIALRDEELKLRVQKINILKVNQNVGNWTIFEVDPELQSANHLCS